MTASIQPTEVKRTIEANMVAPENDRVYDAVFRFSTSEPWAVAIDFWLAGAFQTSWVFGRQLLTDGLLAQSGEGDVRIGPCPEDTDVITIVLQSPSGRAEFMLDGYAIGEWLDETYDEVPAGYEECLFNFDDELAALAGTGKQD
jgi:hypothetical protein